MSDIGAKILEYRRKHFIIQTEFAKKCGVSLQTINSIENEKQEPSTITEARILKVLEEDKEN